MLLAQANADKLSSRGLLPSLLQPRWCEVEPFTLQCFYHRWSHCPPPADAGRARRTRGEAC